jgi:hypothetical protein
MFGCVENPSIGTGLAVELHTPTTYSKDQRRLIFPADGVWLDTPVGQSLKQLNPGQWASISGKLVPACEASRCPAFEYNGLQLFILVSVTTLEGVK